MPTALSSSNLGQTQDRKAGLPESAAGEVILCSVLACYSTPAPGGSQPRKRRLCLAPAVVKWSRVQAPSKVCKASQLSLAGQTPLAHLHPQGFDQFELVDIWFRRLWYWAVAYGGHVMSQLVQGDLPYGTACLCVFYESKRGCTAYDLSLFCAEPQPARSLSFQLAEDVVGEGVSLHTANGNFFTEFRSFQHYYYSKQHPSGLYAPVSGCQYDRIPVGVAHCRKSLRLNLAAD